MQGARGQLLRNAFRAKEKQDADRKADLAIMLYRNKHVITRCLVKRLGWEAKGKSNFAKEMSISGYYHVIWNEQIQNIPVYAKAVSALQYISENKLSAKRSATTFFESKVIDFLEKSWVGRRPDNQSFDSSNKLRGFLRNTETTSGELRFSILPGDVCEVIFPQEMISKIPSICVAVNLSEELPQVMRRYVYNSYSYLRYLWFHWYVLRSLRERQVCSGQKNNTHMIISNNILSNEADIDTGKFFLIYVFMLYCDDLNPVKHLFLWDSVGVCYMISARLLICWRKSVSSVCKI